MVIKQVWYWHENGNTDQWNKRQSPEQIALVVHLPWTHSFSRSSHKRPWITKATLRKGPQESGSLISDDTTKLWSSKRYGTSMKIDTHTSGTKDRAQKYSTVHMVNSCMTKEARVDCHWTSPNPCAQHTARPNNTQNIRVWNRERFITRPCKEMGGSCPINPNVTERFHQSPFKSTSWGRDMVSCYELVIRASVLEVMSWSDEVFL